MKETCPACLQLVEIKPKGKDFVFKKHNRRLGTTMQKCIESGKPIRFG